VRESHEVDSVIRRRGPVEPLDDARDRVHGRREVRNDDRALSVDRAHRSGSGRRGQRRQRGDERRRVAQVAEAECRAEVEAVFVRVVLEPVRVDVQRLVLEQFVRGPHVPYGPDDVLVRTEGDEHDLVEREHRAELVEERVLVEREVEGHAEGRLKPRRARVEHHRMPRGA
jgi:hypothetical protein